MFHAVHRFLFFAILVCKTGSTNALVFDQNGDCMIEEHSVTCGNSLPKVLPENITGVTIKDFLHYSINKEMFKHISWASVTYLDVTINYNVDIWLHDHSFSALTNLKTLGIHSSKLTFNGNKYIFHGLPKLQLLNLSSCFYLTTAELLVNLETRNSLDTLILDQFATFNTRQVILDDTFLKMISKLKVRKLSLSGCNLLVKGPFHVANLSFSLTVLDFSNITLITQFDSLDRKRIFNPVLSNLKVLNISDIPSRFYDIDYELFSRTIMHPHCNESFYELTFYYMYKIEHLEMNNFFSRIVKLNNSFIDLSDCQINLKSWHLRSNNIRYLNATLKWPKNLQFFEIDLSLNDLEYLSPFVFGSVLSLEKLHLAHNRLYFMASFKEFKYLFSTFKDLWYLNLSNNRLSWLHKTMFSNTFNLTSLDLSYNQLPSIHFEITHLTKLRLFNIENNKIHYIDGADFSNLILLTQKLKIQANISFLNNPIVCSCESVPFIKWLSTYDKTSKLQSYDCSLEGKHVPLDNNAVDESEFLCIRLTIVTGSVSMGIVTLCIICLVTAIVMYRKRQQRRTRDKANFLENFRAGLLRQKFLCFISYSSEDEGNDISNIYEHLGETLKDETGIEQEVICLGNKHFNLGFPIVDEILRCISESCVAAFIVSNNFCESHWCQNELREAYELNKPIILICKEEIDLKLMQPFMLKIFRQYTRAKLVTKEDGQTDIVPGYQELSCSILKLAAMHNENVDI